MYYLKFKILHRQMSSADQLMSLPISFLKGIKFLLYGSGLGLMEMLLQVHHHHHMAT